VRFTRLIIIACVLFALIAPLQAFAQSDKFYGDVKGTVFSQAFKISGATVSLWSLTSSGVQDQKISTVYTNSNGVFSFPYVAFEPDQPFQYMVRADKGSDSAIAWVYSLPGDPTDNDTRLAYVAPISMDLSIPSRDSEVTVTVWSTEGQTTEYSNLVPVPGVKLSMYSVDPASGNRTLLLDNKITDSIGQYIFNVPYGMYIVRAEKSGMFGEQSFAAYQQGVATGLSTDIPIPSVTPTPGPETTPVPSSTPGFEAIAALIALIGGALYLRRA
jgi:PGF-CTERM protein